MSDHKVTVKKDKDYIITKLKLSGVVATAENVRCEGIHFERKFQRSVWYLGETKLFIENVSHGWMKPMFVEYWLPGWQHTKKGLMEAIKAHKLDPSKYNAMEEFYGEGFFPQTNDFQAALDYVNACGIITDITKEEKE